MAAAGAVDHKQVVEEVTQKFASFGGDQAPKPQVAQFGKGGSRVVHRDLEQAHLTLALEGVPQSEGIGKYADPDGEHRVVTAEVVVLRHDQAEQDR